MLETFQITSQLEPNRKLIIIRYIWSQWTYHILVLYVTQF